MTTESKPNPKVRTIIEDWLQTHGYDGLYAPGECACKIGDLVPCSEPFESCRAGHVGPCDCGGHDLHIGRRETTTTDTVALCPKCRGPLREIKGSDPAIVSYRECEGQYTKGTP